MERKKGGYKEAQLETGLPLGTLNAKVSRQEIPHIRLGKRLVLFDLQELREWLSTHHIPPKKKQTSAN